MFEASELFDLSQTRHAPIFDGCRYAWEALPKIAAFLAAHLRPSLHNRCEGEAYIGKQVFVGEGTLLEDGVMIKGPAIIGSNCRIRHNAYIRENVIIGDNCMVGNSTEIKNSLFFNNAQAPHFNYVGDSILGYKAHLGAGVKISNFTLFGGTVVGGDRRRAVRHWIAQVRRVAGGRLRDRLQRRLKPGQHHRALFGHLSQRLMARHFARSNDCQKQSRPGGRGAAAARQRAGSGAMIRLVEDPPAGKPASLIELVGQIFSPKGILSKSPNFEYRPHQQKMAVAVARALEEQEHLIVEAGTGVGKSLAYLIPAILFAVARHKKAVISTHTINLQEQLTDKDLPMLAGILPVKFNFTMLKGRQNYLCTRRLEKVARQAGQLFTSPEEQELRRIHEWSKKTEDGSLSDFEIEPDPRVWQQVCSERGLCTPKLCGHSSDFVKDGGQACFFQKARSRILAADVLVLNHTLFFMHLGGLEEELEGGILFKNDFVIFDEAHTVEKVASRHIGLSVSSAQLRYGLQRLWNPQTKKGLLAVLRRGKGKFGDRHAQGGGEVFRGGRGGLRRHRRRTGRRRGRPAPLE